MKRSLIILFSLMLIVPMFAQDDMAVINLRNASFEGYPQSSQQPDQWTDCGFPDESAPDTQPFGRYPNSAGWGQRISPQEGFSYIGMVIRDNDTWERVSQRLSQPLKAGNCYEISLFMCSSPTYISQSRVTNEYVNYNEPCVLRIRSARFDCEPGEILAESKTISHNFWLRYTFTLRPQRDVEYLMFEAFYKTPTLFSYNGNILLDNVSSIEEIPCNEDDVIAVIEDRPPPSQASSADEPGQSSSTQKSNNNNTSVAKNTKPEEKILKDLEREKLEVGQTIQIQTLTFATDSSMLRDDSYPVLNEISQFLRDHKDVIVEIGGHTSRQPGINRDYCLRLSNARAKAVRDYLVSSGVGEGQLAYRGYGYSRPVSNNVTKEGRLKNQRVEIKIIKLEI